jgi:hypothetical protein
MQRWLSILLGAAAVALLVVVVVGSMRDKPAEPKATLKADAAPADAGKKATDAGGLALLSDLDGLGALEVRDGGFDLGHFADGRPVPPLPSGAPKQVKLGIVLMIFAGAQGAPPSARDRKQALELATKLAADAKTDFHGAVVRGDSGSADDIGRIPRGVLEPATEYTVFTLPVGGVSDPIETPRGYWVAKRID